jgi:hypothetical protein
MEQEQEEAEDTTASAQDAVAEVAEEAVESSTEETAEEVEAAPVEETAEEAPGEEEFDFSDYDFADIEGVPDRYRPAVEAAQAYVTKIREELTARVEDLTNKADYHRELWERMLREDDPSKYDEYKKQIEALELDIRNRGRVIEELTQERDILQSQYETHASKSNEQYLTYVQKKWQSELEADAQAGGPILQSAEDLIVELNFDPDEALELGFVHGIEAMAEAADLVSKGLSPDDALVLAKKMYTRGVEVAATPTEPEQPTATHSPAADILDDDEFRAPEAVASNDRPARFTFDPDGLRGLLSDIGNDLFNDKRFRRTG